MFTWICPKCGKEVQPSDDECPYCREAGVKSEAPEPATPEPPAPKPKAEPPAPPVAQAPPKQPAAVAKPQTASQKPAVRQSGGMVAMPGWVVALIVAVGLIGIAALIYALTAGGGSESSSTPAMAESPFETVPEAAEEGAEAGSMARYIEASGIRITEAANGRLEVRFLIINHSGSDIGDLAGTVYVRSLDGETTYTSADFHTTGLAAYESIEFTVVRSSNVLAQEVPEWWNLRGDVEITFPSDF